MSIFSLHTTDMPLYDDFLHGRKRTEYGIDISVEVVHMSPDSYLQACADLHGSTLERQQRMILPNHVETLLQAVKKGEQLPLPMLDYVSKGQEGRHRAMVASRLGQSLPVLVVRPSQGE